MSNEFNGTKPHALTRARQSSYLVALIAGVFLLMVRLISVVIKLVFGGGSKSNRLNVRYPSQTSGAPRAAKELAQFVGDKSALPEKPAFADTVIQPQKCDYPTASRIHIVNLEVAPGVQIGRVWFYLYPETQIVRRVFRVEDQQLQDILGDARTKRSRYYMTDVKWDPSCGDTAIKQVEVDTVKEIKELVYERAARRSGSRIAKTAKAVSSEIQVASERQPRPVEVPKLAVQVPAQAAPVQKPVEPIRQVVQRRAAGESYEGVIAEMGRVPRPSSDGGTYLSYCLKLDVNGIHKTFYGVELERELLERQAQAGDGIKLVSMGRQNLNEGDDSKRPIWKNLYKVEILKKG